MTDEPFVEHIRHVLIEHASLFRSRVREELNADDRAMKLAKEIEDKLKALHKRTSQLNSRQQIKERVKKKIKPFVRRQLFEIRS